MLGIVATLILLTACQVNRSSLPPLVNAEPQATDQAMELRLWGQSDALYPNGSTVAGATGLPLVPSRTLPDWEAAVVEYPLCIGQWVLLPVILPLSPSTVVWADAPVPPTYTGVPPLPAAPVNQHIVPTAPTTQSVAG